MNWAEHHSESERLAGAAHDALRKGDSANADSLYLAAGKAEQAAFDALEPSKERTRGITAVSAVSLFYKGKDYATAQAVACRYLATSSFRHSLSHKSEIYFKRCGASRLLRLRV